MSEAVVEAQGVSMRFFRKTRVSARDFPVLAQVDLALERGALVEITGRSGSGKSTLLNIMAGLLAPSEGHVLLDGTDLYALDDAALSRMRNSRMGVIPQGQTALASLTVAQNVMLPYGMYQDREDAEERALDLLAQVGIKDLADVHPRELSGGEMRRMAIARALICQPDVIFADEPTGDLDDENTQEVLKILRTRADAGAAVLLVTHEQAAAAYADRVLRMDAGTLKECNA